MGRLGIVDGDRLEPSNLHRQTWYAFADCGREKALLAAARVQALNPEVRAEPHVLRLDAGNAEQLVRDYDLVLDCSDNFSTKFLLNDIALRARKPVLFASVYQYEGQLQLVTGDDSSACLRCVWPEATRDGLVGNCAEAGVLGPVPGVFGSLQALEALKFLLGLPGLAANEMLIFDLVTLSTQRLRARRAPQCVAHQRGVGSAIAAAEPLEVISRRSRRHWRRATRWSTCAIRRNASLNRCPCPVCICPPPGFCRRLHARCWRALSSGVCQWQAQHGRGRSFAFTGPARLPIPARWDQGPEIARLIRAIGILLAILLALPAGASGVQGKKDAAHPLLDWHTNAKRLGTRNCTPRRRLGSARGAASARAGACTAGR